MNGGARTLSFILPHSLFVIEPRSSPMQRLRIILVLFTLSATTLPGRAAGSEDQSPSARQPLPRGAPTAIFPGPAGASFAPVFAGFVSALSSRGRAIHVSVVLMCLALLILMKKFADTGPVGGPYVRPSCRTS